jgi:AraC family transcriptional regulator
MTNASVITKIDLDHISPRVLGCELFNRDMSYIPGYCLNARSVYDYELEYFLESGGEMIIDGKVYPISKGDVVFRRPGQTTQGIMNYCCYAVYFDLLGNTSKDYSCYQLENQASYQDYYVNPVLDIIPTIFHPAYGDKYEDLYDRLLKEFIHYNEGSSILLKSYLLQLLHYIYYDVLENIKFVATPYSQKIKKVVEYVNIHYAEQIRTKDLSSVCGMSFSHFHRIFTQVMNDTPNNLIIKVRLDKAKEYIVRTEFTMYDIAEKCGFDNVSYFSYLFKQKTGLSPSEFRKKHRYLS